MKHIMIDKNIKQNTFVINGTTYGYTEDDDVLIVDNMPRLRFGKSNKEADKGRLTILEAGARVVVHPGDTLDSVASTYGVTKEWIMTRNGLSNPTLFVGQLLEL